MFEFIKGTIIEVNPSYVVLEANNIGYFVNISLFTYTQIQDKKETKLLVHEIIREDSWTLYGFLERSERNFFLLLLSVSGIGANTARMMLSSLTVCELEEAILSNNVNLIKSIKGIGLKTAQRVIVELKDKIVKGTGSESTSMLSALSANNQVKQEAMEALTMLGFNKNATEKVLDKLLRENPNMNVEQAVKQALRIL